MLKALHGWYQWKAEIESNLEVPSIQSTFWVMWRKFNIKLSHSVFTWPLFVRKCLFFQTNQPFTQTCDICTHIVSYMVGKLLKRSTFLRTQLHSYDANLKSYEFIPHAGISYMWDLTPHLKESSVLRQHGGAGPQLTGPWHAAWDSDSARRQCFWRWTVKQCLALKLSQQFVTSLLQWFSRLW